MDLCVCIAAADPRPLERRAAQLATYGIPCLEITWQGFPHWDPPHCRRIRAALADHGLRMHSIHAPFGPDLNILDSDPGARLHALEAHCHMLAGTAAIGAEVLVMHPGREFKSERPIEDVVEACVDAVGQVTRRAADLGLRVALENVLPAHAIHSHEAIAEIVDRVGHPSLGICLDTGHANVVDSVDRAIEAFGTRIIHVHLHDNHGEADEHLCPSLGAIDWPAVVGRLRAIGFPGPLTLECKPPPDVPPEGIRGFVVSALGLDD